MTTEYLGTSEEKYARRVGKVAEFDARHVRPLGESLPVHDDPRDQSTRM